MSILVVRRREGISGYRDMENTASITTLLLPTLFSLYLIATAVQAISKPLELLKHTVELLAMLYPLVFSAD
jgi:hypothetical protein